MHQTFDGRQTRFLRRLGLFVLCLAVHASVVRGQIHDDPLQRVRVAYEAADFDQAIRLCAALARDSTLGRETRKAVYQYLGRAYVAKELYEEARQAIEKLLDLEPPLVELDPDIEPPPFIRLYYDVRKARDGTDWLKRDSTLKTMAIVDFTNGSIGSDARQYDGWRLGLASMMIHYLNGATDLKVVERERLQWILDEIGRGGSGVVDPATAVMAGKMLGAHTVLIGTFMVTPGQRMLVGARLVNVETTEVLLTAQEEPGSADAFYELLERLSRSVAEAIKVDLPDTILGARRETNSLDAMKSYSDGLLRLEAGAYREAYELFQKALRFDPNYEKARRKAQSLKPLIS